MIGVGLSGLSQWNVARKEEAKARERYRAYANQANAEEVTGHRLREGRTANIIIVNCNPDRSTSWEAMLRAAALRRVEARVSAERQRAMQDEGLTG